jgi:hypothetical protein
MIVQAAFSNDEKYCRVADETHAAVSDGDDGAAGTWPFLFQTNEATFYEKCGAAVLPRDRYPVFNSTGGGSDAKRRAGFWDDFTMIYPSTAVADWPDGPIDLLGPGY